MTGATPVECGCRFAVIESLEDVLERPPEPAGSSAALSFADGSPVPQTLRTSVVPLWNHQALFLIFSGAYQRPVPPVPERIDRTERLWELEEVYECFVGLDARQSQTYLEFEVAPDGRWIDLQINFQGGFTGKAPLAPTGFRCRSSVSSGIWSSVFQIPWPALGCSSDLPGCLDCNFYRSVPASLGGHLMSWAPVGYGERCFHRPEKFGRMVLHRLSNP